MDPTTAKAALLDEKIARIRKQNEEIIKRKQLIDAEIKSATLNNAIVNTKKSFSDVSDEASLYSDSVSNHHPRTVVYPKMELKMSNRRNMQEDVAWRREREQIDNERIRRQKAASGWKREWDANKTLENENEQLKGQRETGYRSQGRRLSRNDDDDWNDSSFRSQEKTSIKNDHNDWDGKRDANYKLQGRSPIKNNDNNQSVQRETNYRSQGRAFVKNDGDWRVKRDTIYRSQGQNSSGNGDDGWDIGQDFNHRFQERKTIDNRTILKSGKLNDSGIRKTFKEAEPKKELSWRTSGPLNKKKGIISEDTTPNVVMNKVTKYSQIKIQSIGKDIPWRSDFSNKEDTKTADLQERLKKIVIHINSDADDIKRKVEVIDEPLENANTSASSKDLKTQTVKFDTRSLKDLEFDSSLKRVSFDNSASKNVVSHEPIQTQTFINTTSSNLSSLSFGDTKKTLETASPSDKIVPPLENIGWKSKPPLIFNFNKTKIGRETKPPVLQNDGRCLSTGTEKIDMFLFTADQQAAKIAAPSSSLIGILKKDPSSFKTKSTKVMKTKTLRVEETVVNNEEVFEDDEWEDVSDDDEWEDVSD